MNQPSFIINTTDERPGGRPDSAPLLVHRMSAKSEELPWFNSVDPLTPSLHNAEPLFILAYHLWTHHYGLGHPRRPLRLVAPAQTWIGHVFLEDLFTKDTSDQWFRVYDDPDGVVPWAVFGHAAFVSSADGSPAFWFWFTLPIEGDPAVHVFTTMAVSRILQQIEIANGSPIDLASAPVTEVHI